MDGESAASSSQGTPRYTHPHQARPLFNEPTPALSHAATPAPHQPVASTSAQPYTPAMNGHTAAGLFADYEDELDELQSATEDEDRDSSDEEALAEQQERAVQAKKMDAVKGLYRGERVLPEEEFGSKTVREIYDMLKAGVINLSPEYQREAVWPETHSAGLNESLLRNMHVPELLFNVYTPVSTDKRYKLVRQDAQIDPEDKARLPAGWRGESDSDDEDEGQSDSDDDEAARKKGKKVPRKVWNCADGKQRITAIKSFIEGKFAAVDDKKKRFFYSGMDPQARKLFDSKRLRYGFYRELSDAQEREIFKRVQLGKALDKGEIMNAITSAYATWIHELRQKYFSVDDSLSFRPRILLSKRGKVLTAAYVMSRNLMLDFDSLAQESEAKRTKNMQELPVPSEAEVKAVVRAIERFKKLTLVKALPGEDEWPSTSRYVDLRDKNVPVPHRVWRLRPSDVDVERVKATSIIPLAPIEIHLLPAVVQKFYSDHNLSDGKLLEVVHRLRIHVHETFPREVKDNSKTYQLVKAWVKDFDVSTLEHWYNDDGSLRKSYDPSSAARRRRTAEAAAMAANPVAVATHPATNGSGVNGSPAQAKAKKRALILDESEDDEELDERALAPEKKKKKKKETGDRVQRSASGDPLPFTSSADNLQPGARPPPVVFGDTGSSTNGSASNTPAFGRARAGTPAQPRVDTAAQPQPQATPAPPAGPSAKQAKYAQRIGLATGGLASSSAPAASTSKGAQAPSAAPPPKRQPQPQPRLKRTGKFDDAGRPIWAKIDSPPPAAALTTAMPDQVMDERSWGTVDFEGEETLSVIMQKEAARAHQQPHQQAQPQRLYGATAAPPNPYPAYDTSSQYRALADTPAVTSASISAAETQIKPDPEAVERQEASGLAAAVRPDEARRDDEVFAVVQKKRASSREASMRPPAAPANECDRESSSRWAAPPRPDYRDDSRYDRSASRDAYSAAPPRSQSRLPVRFTNSGSNGTPVRQNSGDNYSGAGPSLNGYGAAPSNGYDGHSSGYGGHSNGYGGLSSSSYSNGFHRSPTSTNSGSNVANAWAARGTPLPDQNDLRPPEKTKDPRRR